MRPQRATDTALPPLNTNVFREALGRFATGITVMTTLNEDGTPYGVTATSFASLSLDPPLVQWSLRNAAFSLPVFLKSGRFSVNVLSANQAILVGKVLRARTFDHQPLLYWRGDYMFESTDQTESDHKT